jgi:hypothetical protein
VFSLVDAGRGAKTSMSTPGGHTSKGGGWLVDGPGGVALSYASEDDFLLKRPPVNSVPLSLGKSN